VCRHGCLPRNRRSHEGLAMIPLGILAAQAPPAGAAFELISTTVLTANTASVTFSAIPQDYKHLQVRAAVRTTRSFTNDELRMRFNGITSSSYAMHFLRGTGSGVFSGFLSGNDVFIGIIPAGNSAPAQAFGAVTLDILDYASTSKNTTGRSLVGAHHSQADIWLGSQLLINTAALTQIQFFPGGGSLATGSRFSLYGIKG
jgi:hypothetical protein